MSAEVKAKIIDIIILITLTLKGKPLLIVICYGLTDKNIVLFYLYIKKIYYYDTLTSI